MGSCAIDISDRSIKYGELIATPHGLRLGKYGHIKIPSEIVVSGKIEDENSLIKILSDLRKKEKLNFVRVSLPEEQTYLFTLSIPRINNENIRETISFQIEEHVPLKAPDITFDYNVICENNNSIYVEVAAIATETANQYLHVFEKAKLTPLSFEIEAEAIGRAIIPKGDKSPVMIVDFGNNRTGISVAYDGRILMTTTLDLGGYNLTNMISKNFNMSFEEAEELKRSYGLRENSNKEDIFPIILNGISVLRDELNKQSLYWKNHYGLEKDSREINHIILCGGDANLSGLASYLETSMNIKVVNADTWINISLLKGSVPSISFEESLSYATVLGLALADFSYNKPILNLLLDKQKKINNINYWKRFVSMLLYVLSLTLVLSSLILFPVYFFSKEKENLSEYRLEIFNKANPDLNTKNMDNIINDVNNKLVLLSGKKSNNITNKIISDILNNKPAGITYNQIIYNKRTDGILSMEIYGVANNRNALRNLENLFKNNKNLDMVDFPISNFIESNNINFRANMNIK